MSQYITVQEFKNAPTGIDPLSIIPGGTQAQNDTELFNVILRASAWVDQICKQDTLEATVNTETKEITMNNMGLIRVHPDMFPIVSLTSAQYRVVPIGDWIPLPLNFIQVLDRYFTVYNLNSTSISPVLAQQFPAFGYYTPYRIRNLQRIPLTIQYTYVNGYPNTSLTASVVASGTSITVQNATGVYVGQKLTIYDNEKTESVVVSAINGNVLTLNLGLVFAHNANTPISALPANVKQATILLASYLIKERGSVAVVVNEAGVQGINSMSKSANDIEVAKELLQPFVRGVIS